METIKKLAKTVSAIDDPEDWGEAMIQLKEANSLFAKAMVHFSSPRFDRAIEVVEAIHAFCESFENHEQG